MVRIWIVDGSLGSDGLLGSLGSEGAGVVSEEDEVVVEGDGEEEAG